MAEKRWLGEQHGHPPSSSSYGLKVDTVDRYALRLSKGRTFTGVSGRPLGSKDKTARKPLFRRPNQRAAQAAPEAAEEEGGTDAGNLGLFCRKDSHKN